MGEISGVLDHTAEEFARYGAGLPPPVVAFDVYHRCGCRRTLRFDPLSPAGQEFIRMVEGSVCRACRGRERPVETTWEEVVHDARHDSEAWRCGFQIVERPRSFTEAFDLTGGRWCYDLYFSDGRTAWFLAEYPSHSEAVVALRLCLGG